jgi:hypothetical protein
VRETALGSKTPAKGDLVGCRDHADRGSRDHCEVGDIGKRRSEGDDLLDALRAPLRQDLCQQAASTVPYQRHRRTVLLLDLRQPVAQAGEHVLGVHDVEADAREVGAVTHSLQPAVKKAHRPIA